jgi:hypothetical protein
VSGPTPPGSPPPEVPEEFEAAYRAAYERALADQREGPRHQVEPEDGTDELPRGRGRLVVGTHRSADRERRRQQTQQEQEWLEEDYAPSRFERVRDSMWFVPVLLALLALLLILGAYAVGRQLADRVAADEPDAEPSIVLGEGGAGGGKQPVTNQKPAAGAWTGPVARLGGVRATASCTSKAGVDASGTKVAYDAGNLTDGVADTTWRCDGSGTGVRITLDLGEKVSIGQVGLIPGYAKTDEENKADRFAENNRVTRVRWKIGDTEVVQRMSGKPDDRNLQLIRVPRTTTDVIELQILAVAKGPRDTTAISEIEVGRAR